MYWASPGVINKPFWAGALIRSSTAIMVISLLYICKIHDMFTAQLTIGDQSIFSENRTNVMLHLLRFYNMSFDM